jgi:hypothetical protein
MNITEKYVVFILDYLGDTSRIQLLEPVEKGVLVNWYKGPVITTPVKIEVISRYTRSAILRLSFDKYKVEDLFFMPINSSPDSILSKIDKKMHKIVNKAFIDDGREDEIKKMYQERRAEIAELFKKLNEKQDE